MTQDELNDIVRRLWRLMATRQLTNLDAREAVLRLLCSVALACCGGDPKKAAAQIMEDAQTAVGHLGSGDVKVRKVVTAKAAEGVAP